MLSHNRPFDISKKSIYDEMRKFNMSVPRMAEALNRNPVNIYKALRKGKMPGTMFWDIADFLADLSRQNNTGYNRKETRLS